jgi:hypothetical protein
MKEIGVQQFVAILRPPNESSLQHAKLVPHPLWKSYLLQLGIVCQRLCSAVYLLSRIRTPREIRAESAKKSGVRLPEVGTVDTIAGTPLPVRY